MPDWKLIQKLRDEKKELEKQLEDYRKPGAWVDRPGMAAAIDETQHKIEDRCRELKRLLKLP